MDVAIDKNVTVGSSNVDLGEVLTQRARDGLVELASKYFGKLTNGAVHFTREGINYRCTISIQAGGLPLVASEAQHKDAYAALDLALDKAGKQMRRMKHERRDDKPERHDKGMREVM
jgi:ribosomal subunit interface protein